MSDLRPELFYASRRQVGGLLLVFAGAAGAMAYAAFAAVSAAEVLLAVLAAAVAAFFAGTSVLGARRFLAAREPELRIDADGIHWASTIVYWDEIRRVWLTSENELAVDLTEPKSWSKNLLDPLAPADPDPELIPLWGLEAPGSAVLSAVATWSGAAMSPTAEGGALDFRPKRLHVFREFPGRLRRGSRKA